MLKLVYISLFVLAVVLTLGAIPYVVLIWVDAIKLIRSKLILMDFSFKLKKGDGDA